MNFSEPCDDTKSNTTENFHQILHNGVASQDFIHSSPSAGTTKSNLIERNPTIPESAPPRQPPPDTTATVSPQRSRRQQDDIYSEESRKTSIQRPGSHQPCMVHLQCSSRYSSKAYSSWDALTVLLSSAFLCFPGGQLSHSHRFPFGIAI